MIKFDIKNRWSGDVQFTAEIDCDESASFSLKLGLAAKWAVKRGANLRGTNLGGANLGYANLGYANLRGTNLGYANLGYANLGYANLGYANLGGTNLGGANLGYANLGYANLRGTNLGGLILIDRAARNDGHEYFAWTSVLGGKVIKAGCRAWFGEDAVDKARQHCMTETAQSNRAQAVRIIDLIQTGYAHHAMSRAELEASV